MKIHNLFHGGWSSNCYYVTDDSESYAVVIDPSVAPENMSFPTKAKLCAVLLTHAHYDHMMELDAWRAFGAPVMVSRADAVGLSSVAYNAAFLFGQEATYAPADRLLADGDTIVFGDEELKVVMTPGHTTGSCCFVSPGVLFSGDTMFAQGGIGRFDLQGGSYDALKASLDMLLSLEPATQVYPGHGICTTIADERLYHGYHK